MAESRRVYVTGRGVFAGGLDTVEGLWAEAMSDRGCLSGSFDREVLCSRAFLEGPDAAILGRHQLLALAAAESAWRSAALPENRNRLRGEGPRHRHPRFGCVTGSSVGGLAAMEEDLSGGNRLSPYALSRWRANSLGSVTTLRYGLGGADFSVNAASATGAQALFLAGSMIRSGMTDAAVVVAADPFPTGRILETMTRNGSISREETSMPLSAGRNGMKPVEGAACLILESEGHAVDRGAVPVAEWAGGECANESYHLMAPNDSSSVLEDILRNCLGRHLAGDGKREVDWISLHATGTPRFDRAEISCLKRFFGDRLPWISAFKRLTGHALGASGLIEAALLCEGLKRGELPPWPIGIDPALGLCDAKPANQPTPRTALQVAQGMGGTVVVNLLKAV